MTPEIATHLMANGNLSRKTIIINNFLGGLFWGLGTVIGATLVVALLISVLRLFGFLPWINDLLNQTQQTKGIHTFELPK